MKKEYYFQFFLIWLFFLPSALFAQPYNPKCKYIAAGISIKGSYFNGDIKGCWQMIRPGVGLAFVYHFSPRVSLVPELSLVRIMADDFTASSKRMRDLSNEYIRNLHFRNDLLMASVLFQYDLYPNSDQFRRRPIYNFYGIAGLSGVYTNPVAKGPDGNWTSLRKLKTENKPYSKFNFIIPVGAGIRYKLAISWDLEVELTYQFASTDYLDDVSQKYPEDESLHDETIQLSNRSAEPNASFTGKQRDFQFIQNELGLKTLSGQRYQYIEGHGPGDNRGTQKGGDSFFLLSFRLIYILPAAR